MIACHRHNFSPAEEHRGGAATMRGSAIEARLLGEARGAQRRRQRRFESPRCYGDSSRASKVYSPSRCCSCQGPIRSSVLITTHQVCLGEIETRGHSVCDTGPGRTPGPTSRDLRGRVAAPPRERQWACVVNPRVLLGACIPRTPLRVWPVDKLTEFPR